MALAQGTRNRARLPHLSPPVPAEPVRTESALDSRDQSRVPDAIRILITAGPTHEPIDAVRYLGNRSSGRMGCAIAASAHAAGHTVTLLLGPTHDPAVNALPDAVDVVRFVTTAELHAAIQAHWPDHDVLFMAAAVADFRPAMMAGDGEIPVDPDGKIKRGQEPLHLQLTPNPDLLAETSKASRPEQTLIGFALEPPASLETSARDKLRRKGVHAIVANPLRTMDADEIEATVLLRDGSVTPPAGRIAKTEFATWLVETVTVFHATRQIERNDSDGADDLNDADAGTAPQTSAD